MPEIERYKRQANKLNKFTFLALLAILTYSIIAIATTACFGVAVKIGVLAFAIYLIAIVPISIKSSKHRNSLVKKYYGDVSKEDCKICSHLLKNINVLRTGNYAFFAEEDMRIDSSLIKSCLSEMSKGKKVCCDLLEIVNDVYRAIETSPEKDNEENKKYNHYIEQLHDLAKRNYCDI